MDPSDELFTASELQFKGHMDILPQYSTNYSIGFLNADGTKTVYVYATPIGFWGKDKNFTLIDTRICNTKLQEQKDLGYVYTVAQNDIQPLYPLTLKKACGVIVSAGKYSYCLAPNEDNTSHSEYTTRLNFIMA